MTGNPAFVLPEWMKQYTPLFTNTGGWDVEELMRTQVNARTNLPVAMLQVAVESQIILLAGLNANDKLPDHQIIAAAEFAFTVLQAELDEYGHPDDGPPPTEVVKAHALLFEALRKASAPETEITYEDLPF